ncbi:N-acetyltransferase family protein [Streptomyces chattanoogensis]|uniref:GNAT family N-acetyltransferase n=1 Tax=Streptomyces chattanoogensis TaxID=66876 RepID=UPI0036C9A9C8
MTTIALRPLTTADAEAAAVIHNHAVRETDATMDTAERTVRAAEAWITAHGAPHTRALGAYLPGSSGAAELVGYGTLSPFGPGDGYRASTEISLCVSPQHQRNGIGSALCTALTRHAEQAGLTTALALIASTNLAAHRLFAEAGYVRTGSLRRVGHQRGRLVDIDIRQRLFPANLRSFGDTRSALLVPDRPPR